MPSLYLSRPRVVCQWLDAAGSVNIRHRDFLFAAGTTNPVHGLSPLATLLLVCVYRPRNAQEKKKEKRRQPVVRRKFWIRPIRLRGHFVAPPRSARPAEKGQPQEKLKEEDEKVGGQSANEEDTRPVFPFKRTAQPTSLTRRARKKRDDKREKTKICSRLPKGKKRRRCRKETPFL